MKAYKLELLVLDFEQYGAEQIRIIAENARGLDPSVMSIAECDIGEWSDEHPLNKRATADAEFARLFATPAPTGEPVAEGVDTAAMPPLPNSYASVPRFDGSPCPAYIASQMHMYAAVYGAQQREAGRRERDNEFDSMNVANRVLNDRLASMLNSQPVSALTDERAAFDAECEKLEIPTNSGVAWKLWQARALLAASPKVEPTAANAGDLPPLPAATAMVKSDEWRDSLAKRQSFNGWRVNYGDCDVDLYTADQMIALRAAAYHAGTQRPAAEKASCLPIKVEPVMADCWSCKKPYTAEQRSEADGNCPHCGVEIELDDIDYAGMASAVEPVSDDKRDAEPSMEKS